MLVFENGGSNDNINNPDRKLLSFFVNLSCPKFIWKIFPLVVRFFKANRRRIYLRF